MALHCAYHEWLSLSPRYIYYLRQHGTSHTLIHKQDHQDANAFICKQLGPDVAETATKRQKPCLRLRLRLRLPTRTRVCVCVCLCVCVLMLSLSISLFCIRMLRARALPPLYPPLSLPPSLTRMLLSGDTCFVPSCHAHVTLCMMM